MTENPPPKRRFGHHLCEPVERVVLRLTEADPTRLLTCEEVAQELVSEIGKNPGWQSVRMAAEELSGRGYLRTRGHGCLRLYIGRRPAGS